MKGSTPSPVSAAPPPPAAPSSTRAKRRLPRTPPLRTAPNVVITLRTVGAKWLVDATRDGPTTTEGAAVSAEVVQTVADHLHDAEPG